MIDYKFNEGFLLNQLKEYVDATYNQHYTTGKIQATEDIIDDGHGTGFCVGNAKKYLKRYGKKGDTPAEWRKDLMKVMHYTLIQLYIHDQEHSDYAKRTEEINKYIDDNMKARFAPQSGILPPLNTQVYGASIDDATPEEWDDVK